MFSTDTIPSLRLWSAFLFIAFLSLNAGGFPLMGGESLMHADGGQPQYDKLFTGNLTNKMQFWTSLPRHGANCMNEVPPSAAYFHEARSMGIEWMRLAYDKWKPARRDYLIGNADRYQGLVEADLQTLKATLDRAQMEGMKIVLVPLSLPGMRWSQNNGDRYDGRIWRNKGYWQQTERFWRDLAIALKDHPAMVAYNLVNEPAPEKGAGVGEYASQDQLKTWYSKVRGTARDLPAFYRMIVASIRDVDPQTPVMLDAGWYGRPTGFSYWPEGVGGDRALYAFHMYEPFRWSNPKNLRRAHPFVYPGRIPSMEGVAQNWDREAVRRFLQSAYDWAKGMGIPQNRMVLGEFGCHRSSPGAAAYLDDVLTAVEARGSHWAFYSFRESYDGYDYELGAGKLPWEYWRAQQSGQPYLLDRGANPVFDPIQRRLRMHQ